MAGCLRERYLELANRSLRSLSIVPMTFKTLYFFVFIFLTVFGVRSVMEARLLSLGAASSKAKPLFPMGTHAHCAYVRGWPQRKQHLHNHRQHKWPDPVAFSG